MHTFNTNLVTKQVNKITMKMITLKFSEMITPPLSSTKEIIFSVFSENSFSYENTHTHTHTHIIKHAPNNTKTLVFIVGINR